MESSSKNGVDNLLLYAATYAAARKTLSSRPTSSTKISTGSFVYTYRALNAEKSSKKPRWKRNRTVRDASSTDNRFSGTRPSSSVLNLPAPGGRDEGLYVSLDFDANWSEAAYYFLRSKTTETTLRSSQILSEVLHSGVNPLMVYGDKVLTIYKLQEPLHVVSLDPFRSDFLQTVETDAGLKNQLVKSGVPNLREAVLANDLSASKALGFAIRDCLSATAGLISETARETGNGRAENLILFGRNGQEFTQLSPCREFVFYKNIAIEGASVIDIDLTHAEFGGATPARLLKPNDVLLPSIGRMLLTGRWNERKSEAVADADEDEDKRRER